MIEIRHQGKGNIITTTCANNCGGKCLLKVHVQDDIITRIETDEDPRLRACARGRAYRQYVYHPDRLRHPLKRIGERGEGKFERISWDEALDTIAQELLRVKDTYGAEAIFSVCYSGSVTSLHSAFPYGPQHRLMDMLGGKTLLAGDASAGGGEAAGYYTYGEPFCTGNDREDLLNSKLIIMWGWDPAISIMGSSTRWIMTQAKEKGIKIVSIDPRYTNSAAAWANQWIPIIPGTDAAMMLAMAYVMIDEGLQDQRFLDNYTVGFELFRDYIMGSEDSVARTPQWAERITGVPATTISALAREFATTRPAALQTGYGPQKTARGDQFMRAGMTLAAMTGNIGIPGGSAAGNGAAAPLPLGHAFIDEFKISSYVSHMRWADAVLKGKAAGYPSDIKLVYISFSNLLVTFQNITKGTEALKIPEFIVVHEQFMTPTARFADILLPVNTCLERNDICQSLTAGGYAIFMPKAIAPLPESKTDLEIFEELTDRLGLNKQFNPKNEKEWFDAILEPLKDAGRKELKKEGYYRSKEREKAPYVAFRNQIEDPTNHPFFTPSGKIEIFSQRLADFNQPEAIPPIPKYIEPWEGRDDPKTQEYPLQLLTGVSKKRAHSTFDNIPWLQEIEPHAMWINPLDAQQRGLKDGQRVLVYNDRGQLTITVKITERIMPGVVSIEGGTWFSPDQRSIDQAGSANVLTRDEPSSVPLFLPYGLPFPAIGSGPTNNSNLVEVMGLEEKE